MMRKSVFLMIAGGCVAISATSALAQNRTSASQKGSLLYYSKIELKWDAAGALIQDTFITLVNDLNADVCVEWKFINGDDALAAIPGVERAHKGWNMYDCSACYTPHENVYWSASRGGGSLGCGAFTGLDVGVPPGRPDPESPGERVLRGYAIAYAVDADGEVISHNHLTGHVDIVNYRNQSAWEYNTYAFQCRFTQTNGAICGADSTELLLNGAEYDSAWAQILFDFYMVGSTAFSRTAPATTVTLDTDLTIYPVSIDTRPNSTNVNGPVHTKAEIVVWDENENDHTGTYRCLDCWDQTLLSNYDPTNNFLKSLIQTDKGKARIDGVQADDCDAPGACCCTRQCSVHPSACNDSSDCQAGESCGLFNCFDPDCDLVDFARGTPDRDCSEAAALLGVSDKVMSFSGFGGAGITDAGMTLVAIGQENAVINRDIIPPTAPLTGAGAGPEEVGSEDAVISTPRTISRGSRTDKD